MKRLLVIVLLMSLCGLAQSQPVSQKASTTSQKAAPPFDLETFYMAFLHRVVPYDPATAQQIGLQQRDYWQAIADRGDLMLGGSVIGAKDELVGAVIFRAKDGQDAKKIIEGDPAVSAHTWSAEVHPWMTMKGVLKPQHTLGLESTYYLGLLVRGPKFSPEDSPERQKIQEGHMANMKRLHEIGKLVAAGPFAEEGELRGLFVFRVVSMQEALELTNTDPAVQAGRLAIKLYEWKLPSEAFAK
ncbi:MAG: YciI family protein [Terriglobales bacterium]